MVVTPVSSGMLLGGGLKQEEGCNYCAGGWYKDVFSVDVGSRTRSSNGMAGQGLNSAQGGAD